MDGLPDFRGRYLDPGARIGLVAPAGPFDREDFERGVTKLERHYSVRWEPGILERAGYLAGSDARRLSELQAALDDPSLDGIIAARGGYGVTRLLARLDLSALERRPKLLVGFSDITALHAQWARARVLSIHGSMVASLGRSDELGFERYRAALEGRFGGGCSDLTAYAPGRAEGILLGGNLTVLSALIGTPHWPGFSGAVLFLEDIGERPYRVDRMLTTWHDAGAFEGVRGVVLGAFVQSDPGLDQIAVQDVLAERLADLGIPVAAGLPAGHVPDNLELPFGQPVLLDATRGELSFMPRRNA
jgi:muramoyltetrapeptide carboxypeptidase